MRAVDIGIGHDDDAFIAQLVELELPPEPQPSACIKIASVPDCRAFCRMVALATLRILPRKRKNGLRFAVARLLGRTAGGIAFDQENFGVFGLALRTIGEFAGQAQLARRGFAGEVFRLIECARVPRRGKSADRADLCCPCGLPTSQ